MIMIKTNYKLWKDKNFYKISKNNITINIINNFNKIIRLINFRKYKKIKKYLLFLIKYQYRIMIMIF